MWPSGSPKWRGSNMSPAPLRQSRLGGNYMEEHLMDVLFSALHRGWHRCCEALHPDPHPTLLEALRDTYVAAAHTVTQFTQDAERMEYPQFRAQLLCMAAEDQGHVTWLRDTLLARGGAIPTLACSPTVAPTSWAALLREVAAERHTYEALLEPMHLAEQADPEMAEGFHRLRAAKQQHREVLLDMLMKSDPYTLPRGPAAGGPADATAAVERARALDPTRLSVPDRPGMGPAPRDKSKSIHEFPKGSSPVKTESYA
jgi:hypothetical protein